MRAANNFQQRVRFGGGAHHATATAARAGVEGSNKIGRQNPDKYTYGHAATARGPALARELRAEYDALGVLTRQVAPK